MSKNTKFMILTISFIMGFPIQKLQIHRNFMFFQENLITGSLLFPQMSFQLVWHNRDLTRNTYIKSLYNKLIIKRNSKTCRYLDHFQKGTPCSNFDIYWQCMIPEKNSTNFAKKAGVLLHRGAMCFIK